MMTSQADDLSGKQDAFQEFLLLLGDPADSEDEEGEVIIELGADDLPDEPVELDSEWSESAVSLEGDVDGDESQDLAELLRSVLDIPEAEMQAEKDESAAPPEAVPLDELAPKCWEIDGEHGDFINYVTRKIKNIPLHSGQTTVGCEKAIAYLKRLDKDISKAIQTDDANKIDEMEVEKIRDTIYDFIGKLEDAHDFLHSQKRKKKSAFRLGRKIVARLGGKEDVFYACVGNGAMEDILVPVDIIEPTEAELGSFANKGGSGLTKEAAVPAVYMDPFLGSIVRLLIRAHVTHGKDLRDVYKQLDDQYSFTPRERLSIHEVLREAGLDGTGIYTDLGRLNEGDYNPLDGKNIEFSTVYSA